MKRCSAIFGTTNGETMNFNKLTLKTQESIQLAQQIASDNQNQSLEPLHIMAALLQDPQGIIPPILNKLGANLSFVQTKIDEAIDSLPKVSGFTGTHLSNETQKIFQDAFKEATALKDEFVSVEHIVLAIAGTKNSAGMILKDQGVTRDGVLKILAEIRGNRRVTGQNPEETYQSLERYARNLYDEAR